MGEVARAKRCDKAFVRDAPSRGPSAIPSARAPLEQAGRLPEPGSTEDADKLLAAVKALNAAASEGVKLPEDQIDEKVVRLFASGASGELKCAEHRCALFARCCSRKGS